MKPVKPIIIFGTGRCGTTVFHQMFSEHPHLAWLSRLCSNFPNQPYLNRTLMKLLDFPVLERGLRKRILPSEGYSFWEHYSKGFREPSRDLLAEDVSVETKNKILRVMSKLTTKKRDRLLLKITGWPRIGFLSELFGGAKFIHVIRDGRAVANSFLQVGFWRGGEGPDQWRWGPLSPEYEEEWKKHDQSPVVLAAIQWKLLMDAAERAIKLLGPKHVLEVKYETLCSDSISTFASVAAFCEIEWNDDFEDRLKHYPLRNTNYKFRQDLTLQQQKVLDGLLVGHLERYGY